jgi:ferrous iron transport protein A
MQAATSQLQKQSEESDDVTLDLVPRGKSVVITGIDTTHRELTFRLLAMGFVLGTTVTMLGSAPFGDPIAIETLGYKISLRKSEARNISVAYR